MNFKDMFKNIFQDKDGNLIDVISNTTNKESVIHMLAVAHAIDLIAKTISKTEIKVYGKTDDKIQEKINEIYYRLNIRPNDNETGTDFLYKLVCKLLYNQQALVVMNNIPKKIEYMYVAEDFKIDNYILKSKLFSGVILQDLEGNQIILEKTYSNRDSIYFTYSNIEIKKQLDVFKTEFSKILHTATENYKKSRTPKWELKNPGRTIWAYRSKN